MTGFNKSGPSPARARAGLGRAYKPVSKARPGSNTVLKFIAVNTCFSGQFSMLYQFELI